MTEVLHANIFFFITSVAVVLFTLLLCVLLYHVIKIVRSVRRIVERVEHGSEVIAEDMAHLRTYVAEGSLISSILGIFMKTRTRTTKKKKSK